MEEQIKKLHGKKIRIEHRKKLADNLPQNMHIDKQGILRYKNGMHPNSRKNLTRGAGRFQPGTSGFEGRRHITRRSLRAAYQTLVNIEDSIDGRKKKEKIGVLLASMHFDMLKKAFIRNRLNIFSRLLTDLRIFSDDSK